MLSSASGASRCTVGRLGWWSPTWTPRANVSPTFAGKLSETPAESLIQQREQGRCVVTWLGDQWPLWMSPRRDTDGQCCERTGTDL